MSALVTSIRVIYMDNRPNTWIKLASPISKSEALDISNRIKSGGGVCHIEIGLDNGKQI